MWAFYIFSYMNSEKRVILTPIIVLAGIIGFTVFLLPAPHKIVVLSSMELSISVIVNNLLAAGGYYLNYYLLIPAFNSKRSIYFTFLILYAIISLYLPSVFNFITASYHIDFRLIDRIGFAMPYLMLLSGAYMLSYILRRRKEWSLLHQEKADLELQKKTMELTVLKHQIQPHFFFNTLNGIYGLAIRQSGKTPETILRLSDMMRYVLYESDSEKVCLSREVTHITNYMQMQQLRISPNNKVEFNAHDSGAGLSIAPFLLMPFIENNFKYGISVNEDTSMKISINYVENTLYFTSINTVVTSSSLQGVGIRNVKRRLELIYPNQHVLEITQHQREFIVNLRIHL